MKRVLTDEQVAWAYEQCQQGRTIADVANDLFVARGTLGEAFVRYRIKTGAPYLLQGYRGRAGVTEEQDEWAYRKWQEGYTVKEIAAVLCIALPTVYKRLAKYRARHGIESGGRSKPPLVYGEE